MLSLLAAFYSEPPGTDFFEKIGIGGVILGFYSLCGPVQFLILELRPPEARRKARELTRQAARRQQQSNETGEVEV